MVPPNEICVIQVGQILEIINNMLIKCKKEYLLLLCNNNTNTNTIFLHEK